jgi:hypothetical protein
LLAGRLPRHLEGPPTQRADETMAAASLELVALQPEFPEATPGETLDLRPFGPPGETRGAARLPLAVGVAGILLGLLSFPTNPSGRPPARGVQGASPASAPSAEPAPAAASPEGRPSTGFLDLTVEHPLKSGTFILFLDGQKALTAPLSSRVTKKVLFISIRKGSLERALEVAPGPHQIRVEVRWGENVETEEIRGTFSPGKTEHLEAKMGRLLKTLTLDWR